MVRFFGKACAVVFLISLLSCGGSDANPEANILTSHQDLCAGAAPEYEDHGERIATAIACPFVQHTENIAKYGEKLPKKSALYDGTGTVIANVTHTCDAWTLGTDAQGVAVVILRDKGEVISHGSMHAGQVLTNVASPVQLPVQVR